ncbi:hypothetical protein I3842_07G050300 [Carya illinoinensis]|uniref:Leucine-rich repeat-containing N-terminal plant-type domain-containing protein n=1 Tax=Carya illinoinensis TaxID=32201 RepID=A0A922JEB4_CARIL|nr:hypothetical protein I3842_07G050300 [Carya illinoinensis]
MMGYCDLPMMMTPKHETEFGIFGWWLLLLAALFQLSSIHDCLREDRVALLQLKGSGLHSSYQPLTSWNSSHEESNCCEWEHVVCDNTTGRLIELDLVRSYSNTDEVWYLNASLFLPFQDLKYLDLGNNGISGWVPNEGFERLSRLSKLEVLRLDENYINERFLSSLGQISSLKKLYLRYNLLNRPINIPISGSLDHPSLASGSDSSKDKDRLSDPAQGLTKHDINIWHYLWDLTNLMVERVLRMLVRTRSQLAWE